MIIWNFFCGVPQFYVMMSVVLFAVCCYAAASSLNSIEEEIIRFHRIEMMSPLFASHCLRKWKRSHALICCTIDAIDDCFSPTLFLSVTFIFLKLIDGFVDQFMDCFCIAFDIITFTNFNYFSQFIFWLALVCVPVNNLRFKVNRQIYYNH